MFQRVSGIHVIQAVCVKPLNGHNWSFTASLNAQSYLFPFRVAHDSLQWLDYSRWLFDFSPSLLTCNVHHCPFYFLLFNSVLILLISYFVSISFMEVLILFILVLQLQFLFGFFTCPYFLKFLILSSVFC